MHLHLVLDRRSMQPGRDPFRARPRTVHESHPRREDQERQDRFPEDCRAFTGWHAAHGLHLPSSHALNTRSASPADVPGASALGAPRQYPEHQLPVQLPALRKEDCLQEQPLGDQRGFRRSDGTEEHLDGCPTPRYLRHADPGGVARDPAPDQTT